MVCRAVWFHSCCCRSMLLFVAAGSKGTQITVAHTFACVKLSHNQYKVTFFIYFYDSSHPWYVCYLTATATLPSVAHKKLASNCGRPSRNYEKLFVWLLGCFFLAIEKCIPLCALPNIFCGLFNARCCEINLGKSNLISFKAELQKKTKVQLHKRYKLSEFFKIGSTYSVLFL